MKIGKVRGIIWDLDGTLLDSFNIFQNIIREVVAESGHTMPSTKEIASNYHGSLEETVQKLLGVNSADEVNKLMLSFLDKQEKFYEKDIEQHLFIDAIALAQAAAKKGIHQIIVTNRMNKDRGPASPRYIVASTILADCIHEIRAADEVEIRKPDISSIGDWDKRHGLSPDQILVIGDQFVDAKLAINLGARGILVQRADEIEHLESEGVLDSDLITVVTDLNDIELV